MPNTSLSVGNIDMIEDGVQYDSVLLCNSVKF